MKYTTEYFIKKFDAIPESEWTVETFEDKHGRKCALGHCNYLDGERMALTHVICELGIEGNAAVINDGTNTEDVPVKSALELGETPKERILNALSLVAAIERYGF